MGSYKAPDLFRRHSSCVCGVLSGAQAHSPAGHPTPLCLSPSLQPSTDFTQSDPLVALQHPRVKPVSPPGVNGHQGPSPPQPRAHLTLTLAHTALGSRFLDFFWAAARPTLLLLNSNDCLWGHLFASAPTRQRALPDPTQGAPRGILRSLASKQLGCHRARL